MHFLFEAFYKRPLEPKTLVIFRGGTAVIMGILFIAYCGYLGNQIYHDHPLIRLSLDDIVDQYPFPDIEMCLESSRIVITRCDLWDTGYNRVEVPNNCSEFLENGGEPVNDGPSCTLFRSKNIQYSVRPAVWGVLGGPEETKYIEIFWSIANITAANEATAAVPYLDIQLYDPSFDRWNLEVNDTVIPQQRQQLREMELGNYRLTSIQNYTTKIYASPIKYRAIPPRDIRSLIGIDTVYAESTIISAVQNSWPIKPNTKDLTNGDYSGRFSVWIAKSTIQVQTEEPQHTILSAVGLAGGIYGIFTTIYNLLFGMTRHTPWGLVHHVPEILAQGIDKLQRNARSDDDARSSTQKRQPWFIRIFTRRKADMNEKIVEEVELFDQKTSGVDVMPTSIRAQVTRRSSGSSQELLQQTKIRKNRDSGVPFQGHDSPLDELALYEEHHGEKKRSEELQYRIQELEMILGEYFLNTNYLDKIRHRRPFHFRQSDSDPSVRDSSLTNMHNERTTSTG